MKKWKIGAGFALVLLAMVAMTGLGSAHMDGFVGRHGMGFASANMTTVRNAIETGDYEAWSTAMSAEISEENFNRLVERYQNMSQRRAVMQEKREQMKEAFESGDYTAWQEAISGLEKGPRFAGNVTEDNFETYASLFEARQNGDLETAKTLADELGLDGQVKVGKGRFRHGPGRFGKHIRG